MESLIKQIRNTGYSETVKSSLVEVAMKIQSLNDFILVQEKYLESVS